MKGIYRYIGSASFDTLAEARAFAATVSDDEIREVFGMGIRRFESQLPVKDDISSINRALDELRHLLREMERDIRELERRMSNIDKGA